MGYRDEDQAGQGGGNLKWLFGLLAFALAYIAFKGLASAGVEYSRQKSVSVEKVDELLQSDATMAAAYAPMKKYYPQEYEILTAGISSRMRKGDTVQELHGFAFQYMRDFQRSILKFVPAGSTRTLYDLGKARAAVAKTLEKESEMLCAQFAVSGLEPDSAQRLSGPAVVAAADVTRLTILAAFEGRTKPVARGDLSAADAEGFSNRLIESGLSQRQLKIFFSDQINGASSLDQCSIVVALLNEVQELPPEQSARITAFLLKNSNAEIS